MAGDYSDDMYEGKRRRGAKPKPKVKVKGARVGDYLSGMEETKPKPQPFSSAVEGEAQAASREAAKRQAIRSAASTAGRGALGAAARFAGPVGAIYGAYELGDANKDTKPALAARDKVSGFLNRRTEYKQEQADKAAMEAARKRGEAKRDAGKPDYMSQVSANALKKFQDKAKVSIEDVPTRGGRGADIGTAATRSIKASASAPKAAPKAAAKPKEDRMKGFMADLESRNPKNAVLEKLRKRTEMGEKGLSSDNQYADRFKKFGFAKGGHVKADGCAKKGKTRGRII